MALASCRSSVTIGSTDEEGNGFDAGVHLPGAELIDELIGGPIFATFVEGDAEGSFGAGEEVGGDGFGVTGFEVGEFDFGSALESLEVFGDAGLRVGEGGFTGGEDSPGHLKGELCERLS